MGRSCGLWPVLWSNPMSILVARPSEGVEMLREEERKEAIVGAIDKFKHKLEGGKGRVKKDVGKATGDRSLEAQGKGDQVSGDLKQAGENVKDAFKK